MMNEVAKSFIIASRQVCASYHMLPFAVATYLNFELNEKRRFVPAFQRANPLINFS